MTRKSLLRVRPVPETFDEAIQWLKDAEAIPVWSPRTTEGDVYFRRLRSPKNRAESLFGETYLW